MIQRVLSWLSSLAFALVLLLPVAAGAQSGDKPFGNDQLDQMLAQIALYPDPLLSQVLMAATYPDEFAAAVAWSKAHPDAKGDAAVKMVENEPWDPSVASLVAFPEALITLGDKPDYVRNLGDAFLAQPQDVMDSVQRLRQNAQKAGNLQSNEQVKVSTQAAAPPAATSTTVVVQQAAPPPQVIVIEPAQPSVVYVPAYNPAVVYGPWWYPSYPPYYYPPPAGLLVVAPCCHRNRLGRGHRRVQRTVGWLRLGSSRREHRRQPLQQHQRQQAHRREHQEHHLEPRPGASRQGAVSRWRRDAPEAAEATRGGQPRAVPRQGCRARP